MSCYRPVFNIYLADLPGDLEDFSSCLLHTSLCTYKCLSSLPHGFGKALSVWLTQHDKYNPRCIKFSQSVREEETYQFGSPGGSPCSMASCWRNTSSQGMTEACWGLASLWKKKYLCKFPGVRSDLLFGLLQKGETERDQQVHLRSWVYLVDWVASSYSDQRGEVAEWVGRSPPKDTPRASGRHQPSSPQVPNVPKAAARRKSNCAFHASNGSLFTHIHACIVFNCE